LDIRKGIGEKDLYGIGEKVENRVGEKDRKRE
jgi:hypothetical protein